MSERDELSAEPPKPDRKEPDEAMREAGRVAPEHSPGAGEVFAPKPLPAGVGPEVEVPAARPLDEEQVGAQTLKEQTPQEQTPEDTLPRAKMPEPPTLEAALMPESGEDLESGKELQSREDRREAVEAARAAVLRESREHTRRSFVVAAAAAAAGYGFYRWIDRGRTVEMQPVLLRQAFRINASIARGLFRDRALAPTYPLKDARDLRVNGVYGLKKALAPESWRLQVVGVRNDKARPRFTSDVTAWQYRYVDTDSHEDQGHDTKVDPNARSAEKMAPKSMLKQARAEEERSVRLPRGREEAGESYSTLMPGTRGLLLTMQDILALPRHELVTQFKCIEGWSQTVHWAGVRMMDFMEAYPPAPINGKEPRYVYMETPEGDYYTGYDLDACRHPQTLLVTEMMGAPLTQYHGAPLRLHMPIKYGYKQIKRIALISYTDRKPDDYWTKLGYDWYAGI